MEKTDPASEIEDPLEDVECCDNIGCVDGGVVGGLGGAASFWNPFRCCGGAWIGAFAVHSGSGGGVGGRAPVERVVNLGHSMIKVLSSGMLIRFCGSHSKMRDKMKSSSADSGSIDLRNWGFCR